MLQSREVIRQYSLQTNKQGVAQVLLKAERAVFFVERRFSEYPSRTTLVYMPVSSVLYSLDCREGEFSKNPEDETALRSPYGPSASFAGQLLQQAYEDQN
jgi:hypothetical protein